MCQAENPLHVVASPSTVSTRRRDPLRRPCPAQVRAVLRWALGGGGVSASSVHTVSIHSLSPPVCAQRGAARARRSRGKVPAWGGLGREARARVRTVAGAVARCCVYWRAARVRFASRLQPRAARVKCSRGAPRGARV